MTLELVPPLDSPCLRHVPSLEVKSGNDFVRSVICACVRCGEIVEFETGVGVTPPMFMRGLRILDHTPELEP